MNNEATDEVWYKRAVDYHFNNPEAFVFSVPFDIGDKRPTVVTATHAIFKGKGTKKAPAAVVGVQIDYEHFRNKFMNITNKQVRFRTILDVNNSFKNIRQKKSISNTKTVLILLLL